MRCFTHDGKYSLAEMGFGFTETVDAIRAAPLAATPLADRIEVLETERLELLTREQALELVRATLAEVAINWLSDAQALAYAADRISSAQDFARTARRSGRSG